MSLSHFLIVCTAAVVCSQAGIVKRETRVTSTPCGDTENALVDIRSFDYSPKPLTFPATVIMNLEVDLLQDIVSPVSVDTKMELRVGEMWIQLPCNNQFGSCKIEDVCEQLELLDCPSFVTDPGYSCQCPFNQGTYSLSNVTINIPLRLSGLGSYHITSRLYTGDTFVYCLDTLLVL